MMTEINDYNFTLPKQGVYLVDFYADWCAPCRMLTPILERLSEEMKDVQFYKVNVEDKRGLVGMLFQYEVKALPTLLIYVNGERKQVMTGFKPEALIRKELEEALKGV
jgi:thioredoxin 1